MVHASETRSCLVTSISAEMLGEKTCTAVSTVRTSKARHVRHVTNASITCRTWSDVSRPAPPHAACCTSSNGDPHCLHRLLFHRKINERQGAGVNRIRYREILNRSPTSRSLTPPFSFSVLLIFSFCFWGLAGHISKGSLWCKMPKYTNAESSKESTRLGQIVAILKS